MFEENPRSFFAKESSFSNFQDKDRGLSKASFLKNKEGGLDLKLIVEVNEKLKGLQTKDVENLSNIQVKELLNLANTITKIAKNSKYYS